MFVDIGFLASKLQMYFSVCSYIRKLICHVCWLIVH